VDPGAKGAHRATHPDETDVVDGPDWSSRPRDGASRGLGLALARAELARDGGEVLAVPCDVSDRDQVEHLVSRTVDRLGSLDVLVTNAGGIQVGPLPTMRVADFEDTLGVMFWGTVLPTLAALPHLSRARGRIVTITSIGGKGAAPHLLPHDRAKFAAVGFLGGIAVLGGRDASVSRRGGSLGSPPAAPASGSGGQPESGPRRRHMPAGMTDESDLDGESRPVGPSGRDYRMHRLQGEARGLGE
jgi:hypothetical protein